MAPIKPGINRGTRRVYAGPTIIALADISPITITPDGYVDTTSIGEVLAWYGEQGVLPQRIRPDQVMDQSFLEAVLDQRGRNRSTGSNP